MSAVAAPQEMLKMRESLAAIAHPVRLVEQSPNGRRGVYRVILLSEGPGNPHDKHFYTAEAITKGAPKFNGLPAFADHPDSVEEQIRPERSIKDMVGWYEDVDAVPDPDHPGRVAMAGNLVTLPGPSCQWVRDLLDAALVKRQRDPAARDLVGFSINATGVTSPMMHEGDEWHAVEEFADAKSVDIVTRAGAGGRVVALKEAMKKSVVEKRITAAQVEQAVERLRGLTDPTRSLTPVIEVLDSITKGGKPMEPSEVQQRADALARRARTKEADLPFADWAKGEKTEPEHAEAPAEEGLYAAAEAFRSGLEALERFIASKYGAEAREQDNDEPEDEKENDKPEDEKDEPAAEAKETKEAEKPADVSKPKPAPEPVVRAVTTAVEGKLREKVKDPTPLEAQLMKENAALRARAALREDEDATLHILREAKVPQGAWDHLIDMVRGQSPDEKKRSIESYRASVRAFVAGIEPNPQNPSGSAPAGDPVDMTDTLQNVPVLPKGGH